MRDKSSASEAELLFFRQVSTKNVNSKGTTCNDKIPNMLATDLERDTQQEKRCGREGACQGSTLRGVKFDLNGTRMQKASRLDENMNQSMMFHQ
ncbi:MAG: hypothetical protein K2Z81_24870, partial [Cyanobacteria bacterium]|nr:hypothetical protein [Cyanobacteriota bacterium]